MTEPFLLERRLVPKVWGGRGLEEVLGIVLPAGASIGESWELYDRPDGSSRLRGSERTLGEIVRTDPAALVGRGVPLGHGGSFPLLLKFLDAREGLSLQVHPDDAQALPDLDKGKNECCLVLRAGPAARIHRGTRRGVERSEFLAKAHTAEVEQLVYSFAPKVGDVVHFPPGTVHGIGPDVVCFEVQQNSDLTYRFYDFGRGREVHLERAFGVVRVDAEAAESSVVAPVGLPDGGMLLIETPNFVVRRYRLGAALAHAAIERSTDGRYATVTVLAGRGRLLWRRGAASGSLPLELADTAVVPALVDGFAVEADGFVDLAICDPGPVFAGGAGSAKGAGAR